MATLFHFTIYAGAGEPGAQVHVNICYSVCRMDGWMCYTVWQPYRLMTGAANCGCLPTNAVRMDGWMDVLHRMAAVSADDGCSRLWLPAH